MAGVEIFARYDAAYRVHLGKYEVLVLGKREHPFALGVVEELSALVEQLQGVPLLGVVRRGYDDSAVGLMRYHGHLGTRGGAQSDVYHVGAATRQRALYYVVHHVARNTRVASDYYGKPFAVVLLAHEAHVGRRELHDVDGRKVVALRAADGAANAGNRFNQCHLLRFYAVVLKIKKVDLFL